MADHREDVVPVEVVLVVEVVIEVVVVVVVGDDVDDDDGDDIVVEVNPLLLEDPIELEGDFTVGEWISLEEELDENEGRCFEVSIGFTIL